tara:strand:- start:1150 stop:1926 length:777 start_codon:yes stop_codon:yes gene_type:complete
MAFKLGSESREFRKPSGLKKMFSGHKKSPFHIDGINAGLDDSSTGNSDWWNSPQSDGSYGGEDSSQLDGKARSNYSETDDAFNKSENYEYLKDDNDKDIEDHPQFRNKKVIIGAQLKWRPFAKGFDNRVGRGTSSNPTPGDVTKYTREQMSQKAIAEKLYNIANLDVMSSGPTTAGVTAQGAGFEQAYHSKEFRDFVKLETQKLAAKGGDVSQLMIEDLNKWNAYGQIGQGGEEQGDEKGFNANNKRNEQLVKNANRD